MKKKMKKQWFSLLMAAAVLCSSVNLPTAAAPQEEQAVTEETEVRDMNFNKDWKFNLGDVSGAEQKNFDDTAWEDIMLPHDFSITQEFSNNYEAESGFLPGGTGWYRKSVVFPEHYQDQSLILNFDGIYNLAYVYINGTKVGEHYYGYTNFSFDISDLVICDGTTENVIAVKAVNEFPSSRWYSGSGIYRDVTLTVTGETHVALDGTFVTTPDLETQKGKTVTVKVNTKVQNDGDAGTNAQVRSTVVDAAGNIVSDPVSSQVTVGAGAAAEVDQDLKVLNPELWSWENPALYYVKTEVLNGNTVSDTYTTEFGFRYFNFDANTGFSLNGENVKLRGVCMHHDQGALGAAQYRDAIYRQMRILKEMGCNAIRTSHNTPSDVVISVCNELGMLVMDEAFDGWTQGKNGNYNDFGKYFNQKLAKDNQVLNRKDAETWAQFTLEATVNRDKNAPSVIMWSIGNELPTGTDNQVSHYPSIADNLITWIQDIDDTKPITMGDNQQNWGANDIRTQIDRKLIASGGVVGLNYYPATFPSKHSSQPTWPLVGTETASPSNSRGIYDTTSHYSKTGNYQCTAYDTDNVSWGNRAREAWYNTVRYDYMSGEFAWTGFDYIGEPTPWNGTNSGSTSGDKLAVPNSSYFGIIDTAGFPKDSYYYYTSQWLEDDTTLHLVPGSWNEEDLVVNGGFVPVSVYSNAAKVELYLNGEKIGTATRQSTTTPAGYEYGMYATASDNSEVCRAVASTGFNAMSAQFEVKYAEGTLSLKAFDGNGNQITDTLGSSSVTTNSDAGSYLKVMPEKTEIQADGTSLCYISVDVMDGKDQFVSAADNNIRFTLSGNGTIVGVDNGNASTVDKFQQKSVLTSDVTANINAFSGKALVIVRSTEKAGGFVLSVESAGLKGQRVKVDTIGEVQGDVYLTDYELNQEYTFDMGTVPGLQTAVKGTMSDGSSVTGTVDWDEITEDIYNNPGDYTIYGTLQISGQSVPVSASLKVKAKIAAMLNYSRATSSGVVPALPETVSAVLPDGRIYGNYKATWDKIAGDAFAEVGKVVTINGTADISEGVQIPVKATVRVAEGQTMEPKNVAPDYATLTESCKTPSDNLLSIVDGVNNILNVPNQRWTNWNERLLNPTASITFTWDEVKKLDIVKLWLFEDASKGGDSDLPQDIRFAVSSDGQNYEEVSFTQTEAVANAATTYTFSKPQDAKGLRITMTEKTGRCVGLTECEIYTTAFGYESNDTAVLNSWTVDGKTVNGFVSGEFNEAGYQDEADRAEKAVVEAKARDNASVTILPADAEGVVRILVQSEDHSVMNIYQLNLNSRIVMPDEKLLAEFASVINEASGKAENDYTPESFAKLKSALASALQVQANEDSTKEEVEKALTALRSALDGLVKKATSNKPDAKLLADFAAAIGEAAGKAQSQYTAESYAVFKKALENARAVQANPNATKEQVEKALADLKNAQNGLKKKDSGSVALPKKGSVHPYKKAKYKITKSAAKGGTVTFMKPSKKNYKKVTIPATVKIKGITFKVTAIADKALKGNKKLTQVIVGKNVKTIGKSAFEGDGKLKKIDIKSTSLKSVKKNALKSIHAKCTIRTPRKKWSAYRSILKNKGQKSTVKITK